MEMSGELTPRPLYTQRKSSMCPFNRGLGLPQTPFWTRWQREENPFSACVGNWNPVVHYVA